MSAKCQKQTFVALLFMAQVGLHLPRQCASRANCFTEFLLSDAEALLPISNLVSLVHVNAGLFAVVPLCLRGYALAISVAPAGAVLSGISALLGVTS